MLEENVEKGKQDVLFFSLPPGGAALVDPTAQWSVDAANSRTVKEFVATGPWGGTRGPRDSRKLQTRI